MNIVFLPTGWAHYRALAAADAKLLKRLNALIEEARRTPFSGTGKPEPLRDELAGWWSRRIDREHRLIYRVRGKGDEQVLEILQCRFHY